MPLLVIHMLPSQIIEHFGHLSICFGVAAQEQQAHCGYLWIGVARHWLDWQQKAGTAPRAFCLRGAGAAGVAAGAGGVSVRGWRPGGWRLSIGGDGEAARLSIRLIDNSFGILWKVAVSEQGGGLRRAINGNPLHEALNETGIPILVQEPKADLGVEHEWVRAGIGENESKRLGAVIQTSMQYFA